MPLKKSRLRLDAVLDLSTIRRRLAPLCAAVGHPSVDPGLMIRMLLVGDVFAIRSERQEPTAEFTFSCKSILHIYYVSIAW